MTDFEKWYDENYLKLCYTAEENGLVYFQKCDLKTTYEAGAEGYEKQKEINKELVDDIAALNKRIRELEKDKAYLSDNLDKEIETKLELIKKINQLEAEKKAAAEREAQDIRARFPQ